MAEYRKNKRRRKSRKRNGFRVPIHIELIAISKLARAIGEDANNLKQQLWRFNTEKLKMDKIPPAVYKAFKWLNAEIVKGIAEEQDETLRLLAMIRMQHPNLGPYDMRYNGKAGCVFLDNREDPEDKVRVEFGTLQAMLLYNALVKGFELEILPQD